MTEEFWSLNWNDRFVAKLDVEVEGVPEGTPSPVYFAEEGSDIIFHMTASEFKQVFTALLNGCDLTYGPTSTQVLWYFLRNMEYPVSWCEGVANAIRTCPDVAVAIAELVTGETPVREAVKDLVLTDPDINNYITNVYERLTPGQITGQIAGGDCSLSVVAGRAIAIVERLDTNNTDALEILEIGTNDEERLSQILSAFPGFGILPLDELLDFGQDVLEDFAENYAAASTFERKDELAEDIYCLMRQSEDCSITWQQLFDFVLAKVPTAPFDIALTIGDLLQFVGDGDFNNDNLVFYGMILLQLGTITASQNFNGLTAPLLSAITRDATPSSRWEDWDDCPAPDDCPPESEDFKLSKGGYINMPGVSPSDTGYAEWIDGSGWRRGTTVNTRIGIRKEGVDGSVFQIRFSYPYAGSLGLYPYAGGPLVNEVTVSSPSLIINVTMPEGYSGVAMEFRGNALEVLPDDLYIECGGVDP